MEPPKKILIVDDEKFVTDALEGFFHNKGYEIFKAEDGQVCLDVIKSKNLDLVLLDIKLPKVDGIEILKFLRQDYPYTKVIIMTAYDIEYKEAVDNIGCDAFFIKPLMIDELTEKVEELLLQEKISTKATEDKREDSSQPKQATGHFASENFLPKAKLLIVSPRELISSLLKDCFGQKGISNGVYEVAESGLEQSDYIKEFQPDIILLDVAVVGTLGEFGLTLLKMPHPPKEIILFGDPALKWEETEVLIKRGMRYIPTPLVISDGKPSGHGEFELPAKNTIDKLVNVIKDVCFKHGLLIEKGGDNG